MILDRQLVDCFTVSTVQTVCLSHFGWIWSLDVNARHKQFVKNALKSCNWKGSTTVQHPQHLRKEGRDKSNVLPSFWSGSTCLCQQFRVYSHNAARTHPQKTASRKFSFCKWDVACINPSKQFTNFHRKQLLSLSFSHVKFWLITTFEIFKTLESIQSSHISSQCPHIQRYMYM